MARRIKVYFDGGCRPDPAGMEIAVVVRGVAHVRRGLGSGTSMDAEWLALIEAVRIAGGLGMENIVLVGDSAAVVARARGDQRCRGSEQAHLATYRALTGDARPRLRHVKRAQNLAGIALECRDQSSRRASSLFSSSATSVPSAPDNR